MENKWRIPFFIIWFSIVCFGSLGLGFWGSLIFAYLFTGLIIWCVILEGDIPISVIFLWMPSIMSERLLEKWYY